MGVWKCLWKPVDLKVQHSKYGNRNHPFPPKECTTTIMSLPIFRFKKVYRNCCCLSEMYGEGGVVDGSEWPPPFFSVDWIVIMLLDQSVRSNLLRLFHFLVYKISKKICIQFFWVLHAYFKDQDFTDPKIAKIRLNCKHLLAARAFFQLTSCLFFS